MVTILPGQEPVTVAWVQNHTVASTALPLSDNDFLFQPLPLSTTKWWPDEGPAGDAPPLSTKAAEPSAPGVPASFFEGAAAYLGPNPLPTCQLSVAKVLPVPTRFVACTSPAAAYSARDPGTVTGSQIGGGPATLAPNAEFVDWRGAIGAYLLSSVNSHIPGWLASLPDPLPLPDISQGPLSVSQFSVSGLHQLIVSPAIPTSATTLQVTGTAPQLTCTASVSIQGVVQNAPVSAVVDSMTLDAVASLITPVAVPGGDQSQWYVPYVGPLPYSYAAQPFATTTQISSAAIDPLTITVGQITVNAANPALDAVINVLLGLLKTRLEQDLSTLLQQNINLVLVSVYDGTARVG